ncbi:MAG: lysine--tRNA ligase [Chloroflexi bacterium]|nr:lysine--tRNA ligase [Chloroflexota bacterium]|tara:strand:- start:15655 stop:17301 length:1647 start_codon:yes stop_codon:yes gene_type:complete
MPDRGEELITNRLEKLSRIKDMGIDPYPISFGITNTISQALNLLDKNKDGIDKDPIKVVLAGRLIRLRVMGKASFLDLRDGTGVIQGYLRKDLLHENYDLLKELDLWDHVGISGELIFTQTGEPSIKAENLTLLSKSLRPPPDKWHGLKDVELRYRQREIDLSSNDDVRARFIKRSRIVSAIRSFLDSRNFVEVETPVLVPVAAGAMAKPFITNHNALNRTLYMRIATELYLKRCIIGGLDRVYEIGRVFRNEGIDLSHNPEYTLLESYQAYTDLQGVMEMVESMISIVVDSVNGNTNVDWNDHVIDFSTPWAKIRLQDAIREFSGIDLDEFPDPSSLAGRMREAGIAVTQEVSWGRLVDKIISDKVEPHLIQPTFLIDYPAEMSPLAKRKTSDGNYVDRFEAFIGGMEIGNAYSELNDPIDQRIRFQSQEELRDQHADEDFDRIDDAFLDALEYGMPPTGGLGLGIDRLVMLLTDQKNIREVVLFPHLSLSQEEIFRFVDDLITDNRQLPMSTDEFTEYIYKALTEDLRSRITKDEIQNRVEQANVN